MCGSGLVFVAEFDLVLDVVIDYFGVEFEKGEMISFELFVECLQIRLFELLPLIEETGDRLSAEAPRFDLCCGGGLVGGPVVEGDAAVDAATADAG